MTTILNRILLHTATASSPCARTVKNGVHLFFRQESIVFSQQRHPHQRRNYQDHASNIQPGQRIILEPTSNRKHGKGRKSKTSPKKSPPFIDRIRLKTRGGMGGAGELSFVIELYLLCVVHF